MSNRSDAPSAEPKALGERLVGAWKVFVELAGETIWEWAVPRAAALVLVLAGTAFLRGVVAPDASAAPDVVGFRALDGVALQGRLYGSGQLGVVLTHQLGGDATQWDAFARQLAGRGYRTLALNVRGVCPARGFGCSQGTFSPEEVWRDVGGAVRFLRSHGTSRVVLVGASMGGEASMVAAARAAGGIAGVVSLSGSEGFAGPLDPAAERRLVRSIGVPKLFVAGSGDRPAVDAARHYQALSRPPKRLVIVPSSAHGVALFEDRAVAARVSNIVLAFLAARRG